MSRIVSELGVKASALQLRQNARCRRGSSLRRRRRLASFARRTGETQRVPQLRQGAFEEREVIRLGLPSKGRMAEDTLQLLNDCQLAVYKPNPRQYVATIAQLPGVEAWFQRASDVVRKLRYGDVDLGIVGYDMFRELADEDPELILIHEALNFGKCHLALGVPFSGIYAPVQTLQDLKDLEVWSDLRPMRVVTGYNNIARKFFAEKGFEHVVLLSGDGALEAAPAMGSADIILDLVSTGVTLRENNLREIEGGRILDSQGVLVGNRTSLLKRRGLLRVVRELLDRLDAHLTANSYFSVTANMRGNSADEVAESLAASKLTGLQGPTISHVYSSDGRGVHIYAACICVKKNALYAAVKEIRKLGGSGVLVQPLTYIFDEESARWAKLLNTLQLDAGGVNVLL